jgi:uncharacterized protein YoxC
MEVISVLAASTQLFSQTTTLAGDLYRCANYVKNVSKKLQDLADEVSRLSNTIHPIHILLQNDALRRACSGNTHVAKELCMLLKELEYFFDSCRDTVKEMMTLVSDINHISDSGFSRKVKQAIRLKLSERKLDAKSSTIKSFREGLSTTLQCINV